MASDRLRKRVKDAKQWQKDVNKHRCPPDTHRLDNAIEMLEACDEASTANAFSLCVMLVIRLQEPAPPLPLMLKNYAVCVENVLDLEAQINTLKAGLLPSNSRCCTR